MLRAKGRPEIRLALRPARSSDGDALQSYVRELSPQSRYNRFLGAASELPASELARALAAMDFIVSIGLPRLPSVKARFCSAQRRTSSTSAPNASVSQSTWIAYSISEWSRR
jgi:hypothetical protein